MATRYKPGLYYMDYTPSVAVTAGDEIVVGELVCVADVDIAIDELAAIAIGGIYEFAKDDAQEMLQGTRCYWDVADSEMNVDAANIVGGVVMADAALADETVLVRINT